MSAATQKTVPVRIFIVDDEPIVRESLGAWFREDGYDVDTADGAREGLRLAAEKTYDIALIDIKMPGVDGLELQAKLKEIGGQPVGPLARADLPLLKPETPVVEALLLLYRNRTTLPVVDENDCVIGVLSYWDALAAIANKKK